MLQLKPAKVTAKVLEYNKNIKGIFDDWYSSKTGYMIVENLGIYIYKFVYMDYGKQFKRQIFPDIIRKINDVYYF